MELVNKNVKMLDPFSQSLTQEQKELILEECKVNPQYFFEQILGAKANRLTWELIRQMPNYPKDTPGDHDGDMLPYSVENPHPEAGKHYEDGSMRMADGKLLMPMAEEWVFFNEPGMTATRKPGIGDFYRDTIIDDDRKVSWGDIVDSLCNPTLKWCETAWRVIVDAFPIYTRDHLKQEFERVVRGCFVYERARVRFISDVAVFEYNNWGRWTLYEGQDIPESSPQPRQFIPTPQVDIPSIKVPMTPEELKFAAITAWNEVVKGHGNHSLVTEGQLECLFDREIIKAVGTSRVQVKVRAGEPSFSYKVEGRWVPL